MKGQWCEIDKNKFCQEESSCENCTVKNQLILTCEHCGYTDKNVTVQTFQGQTYILCENYKECTDRAVKRFVQERIMEIT